MFITEHRIRKPVKYILGISYQLDESYNSSEGVKECLDFSKQSALTLDTFTVELTIFISNLKQQEKKLNVNKFSKF